MNDDQQFAADVMGLIPDGAIWSFQVGEDDIDFVLPVACVKVGLGVWQATIGSHERQVLQQLLQPADDDETVVFAGVESITVDFGGERIMEGFDGLEFVYFSRYFRIADDFQATYFATGDERVGQAKDW